MKCASHECPCDAVGGFVWPGREPQLACLICVLRAANIADAMGFQLHIATLDKFEKKEALEAIDRLRSTNSGEAGQSGSVIITWEE